MQKVLPHSNLADSVIPTQARLAKSICRNLKERAVTTRMNRHLLLTAILLAFLVVDSEAQRRPGQKSVRSTVPVARVDRKTEHLPPRFNGMSFADIAAAYIARNKESEKREFETRDEQQARIEIIDADVVRRFGPRSDTTFASIPELSYDADNEEFELRQELLGDRVQVASVRRKFKDYVGQNAFGVKKHIEAFAVLRFYLVLSNFDKLPTQPYKSELLLHVPVPREQAPMAKKNMQMLYVGEIVSPFAEVKFREETPTIDDPTHDLVGEMKVWFHLEEIWLYDYPTGRIWHKWSPAPNQKATPLAVNSQPRIQLPLRVPVDVPNPASLTGKQDLHVPVPEMPKTFQDPSKSTQYENSRVDEVQSQGAQGVGRIIIVYNEKPRYTERARKNKVQGRVLLSAVFRADGTVTDISVVHGLPDGLNEKAIETAKKMRFQPATKNGQPVTVRGQLEYTFNLY